MNRSESKYFNTALCMNEALISLLEVKDLEYITVKEICEKAGVNRSTFYLHYETIDDLVNETAENVNRRFLSFFSQNTEDFAGEIGSKDRKDLIFISSDYLLPYLKFISENKKVYRASFRNPIGMRAAEKYKYLKKYIINPILERFEVPQDYWKYYTVYYIEGTMAVIREWLNNGCRESVETIAAIIEECVRPLNGIEGRRYGE